MFLCAPRSLLMDQIKVAESSEEKHEPVSDIIACSWVPDRLSE